ncbi:MAG: flippase-like domain-containing protein [Candidatus Diapherotrites archaeon]|nr:flippase-like domain-containing protein [Candidatus Diapherotrites archaeon]
MNTMHMLKRVKHRALESFKKAIIALILLIAVFTVAVLTTGSIGELGKANVFIVASASLAFLTSVFFWVFSWAWVLKNEHSLRLREMLVVGFSSIFASLTPMQLGNDALRAYLLKESYNVPFSKGISASMLVKGLKFFSLLIVSVFVLFFLIMNAGLNPALFLFLLSGLSVVFAAALLFLLPLNRKAAMFISQLFRKFPVKKSAFEQLSEFFLKYSDYLKNGSVSFFSLLLLCIISWFFEFLAFILSLASLGIFMPLSSFVLLFVVIAILERVPFTPRGLLFVEVTGYLLLSGPFANLSQQQIISFLAIFDIVRIVVPVTLSLLLFSLWYRKFNGSNKHVPKETV